MTELIALTREIGSGMLFLASVIAVYVGLVIALVARMDE